MGKAKKPMSRSEYLRSKGVKCPACGATEISTGDTEYPSTCEITQQVSCGACGSSWTEFFKLSGYGDLELGAVREGGEYEYAWEMLAEPKSRA